MASKVRGTRCLIENTRDGRMIVHEYRLKVLNRSADYILVEVDQDTMVELQHERPDVLIEKDELQRS